jgi:hypothetical protein
MVTDCCEACWPRGARLGGGRAVVVLMIVLPTPNLGLLWPNLVLDLLAMFGRGLQPPAHWLRGQS